MGLISVEESYCSLFENAIFHFLQETIRATPIALWVTLNGFSFVTHEWYFFMYAHTYLVVFLVQAWLGHLVGWLSDPIEPSCNSKAWVGPSLGAALIGAYVTQAAINAVALRLPFKWTRWAWKVFLVVVVIVEPSINRNTSWSQAFAGLGLGVVIGVVAMWLLWYVWMPLFPALDKMYIFVHWFKLHSCRNLRDLYYRDMCRNDTEQQNHHWGLRRELPRYGIAGHEYASFFLLV